MGMIRKMTSISTLGLVDFKSDKERIANSTRKGMKAQRAMLVEMKKANAATGIAPTNLSRVGFVADAQGRAAVANQPVAESVPAAAPAAIEQTPMQKLEALHAEGILDDAAFAAAKAKIIESTPQYKPGDIANGHVLTSDNTWVPIA